MNQNKAAPKPLNTKKILIFIALITAAIVFLLKAFKETTRVPQPIPLMTPLPSASAAAENTATSEDYESKSSQNEPVDQDSRNEGTDTP